MTVSGACFYLYHFSPATKAHVLADEHQARVRGQLLRYYKALFLAFRDGDLHNTPIPGGLPVGYKCPAVLAHSVGVP